MKYEIKQYILGSGVWFHKRTHHLLCTRPWVPSSAPPKKKKKASCQTVSLLFGALHSLCTLLELFLNGIKEFFSLFWSSLMRSCAHSEILYCMWWLRMAFKWRGRVCGNYLRLSVWSLSSCNCLDPDQKICKESFSLIHRKSILKMIHAPCQCLSWCEWDQLLLKQTQVPSLELPSCLTLGTFSPRWHAHWWGQ